MPDRCVATLSNVTHRYGDVVALDGLDLEVRSGEVLAVLGPNGAGKTTAVGLLLGSPCRCRGARCACSGATRAPRAARMRRGAMLQVSGVADTLTVAEHLELFGSYYPAPLPVSRLLAMAGLEKLRERRYGRLSGGQKQRVMFALALAGDPELVFLDEPTTGLDVEARRSLWNEIRATEGRGAHRGAHHPLPGGGRRPGRPDRGHPQGARRCRRNARRRSRPVPQSAASAASRPCAATRWRCCRAWCGWRPTAGIWRS